MARTITDRRQQCQFTPPLKDIAEEDRTKPDRPEQEPKPPSVWKVERYVFSTA
jgi:hypothetical protein